MNPTDKKVITPYIEKLLASIKKKTVTAKCRATALSEAYVEVDSAAGMPLNRIGLHVLLNNLGDWIVYLSIEFARTAISYEGLAYYSIAYLISTAKLARWLSSKATVKSVYEDINQLYDSYLSDQWLDGNSPTPLAVPADAKEVFYEVWYKPFYGRDPVIFEGRSDSLKGQLLRLIRTDKKNCPCSNFKDMGCYFTYLFHPEDIAYRREYIRRHNERLLNSVNNFTEPVLQAMQDVCYEIAGKALAEFDPDKERNEWNDERFDAGLRIEIVHIPEDETDDPEDKDEMDDSEDELDDPEDEDGPLPSTYYRLSIQLKVPDGLYASDHAMGYTPEEIRNLLSQYTHTPWIVNCLSKEVYMDCVRQECYDTPTVYLADDGD